jgi:LysM repeat protein
MLSGALLALPGCRPSDEILLDDTSNPHVRYGIERVQAQDFDGAIASFERALKVNPQSVRSHFELGLIYERVKQEPVTALYHYNQVLKLQKSGWPAENVKLLVPGCRRELVKGEALAPVIRQLERDLESSRKENDRLRQELANLRAAAAPPTTAPTRPASPHSQPGKTSDSTAVSVHTITDGPPTRSGFAAHAAGSTSSARPTTPPPDTRLHRVRSGETMAAISRLYKVELSTLLTANPQIQPRSLPVGTVVRIPSR